MHFKNIFLLLVSLTVVVTSSSYWKDYTTSCRNIYNAWMNQAIIDKNQQYITTLNETVWKTFWYTGTLKIDCIFPIYHPRLDRINLIQTVISWVENEQYWWMNSTSLAEMFFGKSWWFRLMWYADTRYGLPRMNTYTVSMKEPFSSADSLQFYVYKRDILLVARDTSGTVTDFYFENQSIIPKKEEIQKYLWEKWFQP